MSEIGQGGEGGAVSAAHSVVHTVTDLRSRFDAWSVPEEEDFQVLIGLADLGRQAVGLDTSGRPVEGVVPTGLAGGASSGLLSVVVGEASGLQRDGGLALKVTGGLAVVPAGVSVQADAGVMVDAATQALTLAVQGPMSQEGQVLHVKRGAGLAPGQALGLHVDPTLGIGAGVDGVRVRCQSGGGLVVNEAGQLTLDLAYLMDR